MAYVQTQSRHDFPFPRHVSFGRQKPRSHENAHSHQRPLRISVSSGYGWRARAQANERPNAHPPWQRAGSPNPSGTPIPSLPALLDQRGSVRGYQVHRESMTSGARERVMHSTEEQLRRVLGLPRRARRLALRSDTSGSTRPRPALCSSTCMRSVTKRGRLR